MFKNQKSTLDVCIRHSNISKVIFIVLITICNVHSIVAQNQSIWYPFYSKDSTAIGFKDEIGKVMIEPKFTLFTKFEPFYNIIAVVDENEHYYLTKSGNKVGKDSLYFHDFSFDYENEGYIRYQLKNLNVGLFDKKGRSVIPADYQGLSRVTNGYLVGLTGAKLAPHDSLENGCHHTIWQGGQTVLLNTDNEIIIENFDHTTALNFYSDKLHSEMGHDSIRNYYQTKDGRFLSFIDYKKEFNQWFLYQMLHHTSKENLLLHTYDKIVYDANDTWTQNDNYTFIEKNHTILANTLNKIVLKKTPFSIHFDELNYFIFTDKVFQKFYNGSFESNSEKYPVINVVINDKIDEKFIQNYLTFIRTDHGYRLISATIRNEQLQ